MALVFLPTWRFPLAVASARCRRCLRIGRVARGGATGCSTRSTRAPTWTRTATGSVTCAASPNASTISQWLGVDGIWLDPIMVSPNDDWGYDVADYVDVDPALGTLADADTLIEEAAKRGIRVILDLVPNHTSDRHPWFVDAKSSRDSRAPRLVRVGRSEARRLVPEQLDDGVRSAPARVDVRRGERAVLPQPVPLVAARPELVERGGARRVRRRSCASGSTAVSPASASTSRIRSSRTVSCATTRPRRKTTTGTSR